MSQLEINTTDEYSVLEDDQFTYDPTNIRISTRNITIGNLIQRIDEQSINLAPDFKRRYWTDDVKSRLIESIIIRLPIQHFYIDGTGEDKWFMIDGIQRLYAIKQFLVDKSFKLSGLEFFEELNGKTVNEIGRAYQRRIEETEVTIYLIEKGTTPEVKINICKRINTVGCPKSPQELRQALNPGKSNKYLAKLADSEYFKQSIKLSDTRRMRMDDREIILVFLSFLLNSSR